ncbi:KRAB-A domain-containing protein 2 [Mytilus edulis]|uniref:KRAB-A domain-containing protein 2 n=1 Tax=Mytilus edulis TaxID=6550 RepID=A0A8S3RL57_MYTED|nr:KRAB-A domain-containing protein 2 [Mytilus edulis]
MENSIEKKFHDEIIKLCDDNKSSNNSIFTRERYRETIGNVKEAKLSSKKTALQRYFLRQYDILSVAGIEKLIRKGDEIFYYCTVDELYPLIRTAHSGMCEQCILKKSRTETTKLVVRPITSTDFNSRCQVDIVDYQSCPDGEYKWIMHYQDHLTKFSVLRPLKTKRAAEVAYQLTDIFLLLGAPHILQSDNGREFTANVITELKLLWPELKLVHGRPRHPQSQGSVERANADIKSMMIFWTHENNNTHWSEGLRFVQFHKNRSHHRTIDQSPYKALFGSDPTVGLSSSALPKELLDTLETEKI